ncbi:hypothetical protein KKH27_11440 [bacterium]|nr:hypothetical protein [bacterium]MBU1985512.1 hypothetical protein [bacterium]
MRTRSNFIRKIALAFAAVGLFAFVIAGCSELSAPTASPDSSREYSDLWNPQPGEMINGVEVPLVQEGYWESLYGPTVNPWMMPPRTFRVGPQGAFIRFGYHSLLIPSGAVSDFVMISVSNASVTGVAMDCNPSPFQFNVPVTLTLSYRGTQYDGTNNPPLAVLYMSPSGSLERMPGSVDPNDMTVTAQTTHFSRYIIGGAM